MPSRREQKILLGIGAIAIITFLYSFLIVQQILAWFGIVIPLLFVYLVWRFVRAHERIAAAVEDPSRTQLAKESQDT